MQGEGQGAGYRENPLLFLRSFHRDSRGEGSIFLAAIISVPGPAEAFRLDWPQCVSTTLVPCWCERSAAGSQFGVIG